MDTDRRAPLIDQDLSERVIGAYYTVYNELGPGFLESVYESALVLALREAGLHAIRQAPSKSTSMVRPLASFAPIYWLAIGSSSN